MVRSPPERPRYIDTCSPAAGSRPIGTGQAKLASEELTQSHARPSVAVSGRFSAAGSPPGVVIDPLDSGERSDAWLYVAGDITVAVARH
jgi:hypothetical protein